MRPGRLTDSPAGFLFSDRRVQAAQFAAKIRSRPLLRMKSVANLPLRNPAPSVAAHNIAC